MKNQNRGKNKITIDNAAYEKLKADLAEAEKCPPGFPQKLWDEEVAASREWRRQWVAEVVTHIKNYEASERDKARGSAARKPAVKGQSKTTAKRKNTKRR